ncbi:MAG: hypothetical protein JO033_11575 [Acidobacteriaceae bacterium]|nr:hypothetical protein [Acidobacteriaceae bacterium]MBV9498193.1 hypothetical protein [Acidobacteriaceae bacterium]
MRSPIRLLAVSVAGITLVCAMPRGQQQAQAISSEADQQQILSRVRAYAERYVANLPNFVCDLETRQFQAGKKAKHWHKGDTLISRLTFNAGREEHTLEKVNDRPVRTQSRRLFQPLVTEGEFGMLMQGVFAPASAAAFTWVGLENLEGRRVGVFQYAIDQQHSNVSLSLDDTKKDYLPYHGSIYADPETGAIWRITSIPTDFPDELLTKSLSTVIDYDRVDIAGRDYLLPIAARVALETPTRNDRNELEFRNYRKFEAKSRITYASADDGGSGSADNLVGRPGAPPEE